MWFSATFHTVNLKSADYITCIINMNVCRELSLDAIADPHQKLPWQSQGAAADSHARSGAGEEKQQGTGLHCHIYNGAE